MLHACCMHVIFHVTCIHGNIPNPCMLHACRYKCNLHVTCAKVNACFHPNCACNMHVTCTRFCIGPWSSQVHWLLKRRRESSPKEMRDFDKASAQTEGQSEGSIYPHGTTDRCPDYAHAGLPGLGQSEGSIKLIDYSRHLCQKLIMWTYLCWVPVYVCVYFVRVCCRHGLSFSSQLGTRGPVQSMNLEPAIGSVVVVVVSTKIGKSQKIRIWKNALCHQTVEI